MYSSQGYVLAVGLDDRYGHLDGLSPRLCSVDTGFAALRRLRSEIPSVLVALWDLPDMPDGIFFRRLLSGAISMTTVTIVRFGDRTSEVAARSLGVTVVLDDGVDEKSLAELLCQLSAACAATGT